MKILIFTATYNESGNIGDLIADLHHYLPEADILVVDDNSPDGTGSILEKLTENDDRLSVIHRPGKLGLGSAHKLAMKYSLANGYEYLITLDADFSHNPKYLPVIVNRLKHDDFVIGSRYTEGGKCDYGLVRVFISKTANFLAKVLLGIRLKETTTSYRGFSQEVLSRIDFDHIKSEGYSFFVESLFRVVRVTDKVSEFPIHFEDRRAGSTKISKREIYLGVLTLFKLFFIRIFRLRQQEGSKENEEIENVTSCDICGSLHCSEIFPSTSTLHKSEKFNCTSAHHGSHGRIVRCLQCGVVYTNPQLPEEKMVEMYANVEDNVYLSNLEARETTFLYNFKKFLHLIPPRGKLLEVGSYYGVFLNIAKEYGYEIHGVEPSQNAVHMAKEKYGIETLAPTLSSLVGYDEYFDIITSWDVLEHLNHPMRELEQVAEKLKPGGIFAFSTLDYKNWYPRLLRQKWPWMMDMHIYYFDQDNICHMLEKNNLELIHVEAYCHVITFEYFLMKLGALGIPGAALLGKAVSRIFIGRMKVPFRFGDIKLFVARKKVSETEKSNEK